jgi:inner membrane protein
VPVALLFGLAMLGVVFALRRHARTRLAVLERAAGEGKLLALVAIASPLLHVAMDFANNYGVHPFWPVDSRWFYGDTLFIIEPTLWIAIVCPLIFSMSSRWVRAALGLLLGLAIVALFVVPVIARVAAIVLAGIALATLLVARRLSAGKRVALANGMFFATLIVFAICSRVARARAVLAMERELPRARTVDLAATPMPGDPACWNVLWLGVDGDDYVLRLGHVALAGGCVFGSEPDTTAPMTPLPAALPGSTAAATAVRFVSEYRRPLAELVNLAATRCEVAALLQFARVPYVTAPFADGTRIAGDLRYDRKPELDLADIRLAATADAGACPPRLPPWVPPRADLLGPR